MTEKAVERKKRPKLQRWRASLIGVACALVMLYLVAIVGGCALQTKLIFPGAATQGSPEAVVTPPPGTELLDLKAADGTPIAGLFGKALTAAPADRPAAPTILYFYGNAMCMNDALGEFQQFRRLGANVMLLDFEGYGMSGGSPGEQGCYAAAEAGYQHLLTRSDIDTHKIVPAGWSLGAAVAIDLARRHAGDGGGSHICGLMIFSAFTSLVDEARVHYPFLPVSLLLRYRFSSEEKMRGIHVPVLLGHGRHDEIIPYAMSDRLSAAAKQAGAPVTRFTVEDAGHNDFFALGESAIDKAAGEFLRELAKQNP